LHSGKSVKKTLTIPEWMDEMASAKGINFSQLLQDAIANRLKIE
jgi:post-segregation antitoxin (ccd killing protein)